MHISEQLLGSSKLQALAALRGYTISESQIRLLADKGILTAERDSSGKRLFRLPQVDQLIDYMKANARR